MSRQSEMVTTVRNKNDDLHHHINCSCSHSLLPFPTDPTRQQTSQLGNDMNLHTPSCLPVRSSCGQAACWEVCRVVVGLYRCIYDMGTRQL